MKVYVLIVTASLSLGMADVFAQAYPNLLADPGFEEWSGDPSSTNWCTFGNAVCETITPRSPRFMVKMWGQFKNERSFSGIYQDVPAVAGRSYVASAYLRQNSDDHLAGDNVAWVKVEFFNADRSKLLATFESPVKLDVKSPSKKYHFLSTGAAVAPKETAFAHVVVLMRQESDNGTGAVMVDDVSLTQLP